MIRLKALILIFITSQFKDGCSTSKPCMCESMKSKGISSKETVFFFDLGRETLLLNSYLHIFSELCLLAITSVKRSWEIEYFTFAAFRVEGIKEEGAWYSLQSAHSPATTSWRFIYSYIVFFEITMIFHVLFSQLNIALNC